MKIICIKGGLGNQLFEYSRYLYTLHTQRGERVYLHYDRRRLKEHGGVQLHGLLCDEPPRSPWWVPPTVAAIKALRALRIGRRLYDDEDTRCLLIDDFCQQERFVQPERLPLRYQRLAGESLQWADEIRSLPYPVAVHVRRGDYLLPQNLRSFGQCGEEYYRRAAERMQAQEGEVQFFLFSDDKEWLQAGGFGWLPGRRVVPREAWDDAHELMLMSLCRGHIIANSTFSYWGARLATRPGLNLYPLRWYADPTWERPPIFPHEWQGI